MDVDIRLQGIGQPFLSWRGEADGPAPLAVTGRDEFRRKIQRDGPVRWKNDMAFRLFGFRGRIELQLDVRFTGGVSVIMKNRAQNELVTLVSEPRQ